MMAASKVVENNPLIKDGKNPNDVELNKNNNNNKNTTGSSGKDNTSFFSPGAFKLVLLIMMVLQNSSAVLVGRHTRSSKSKEDLYSVNHLVFTVEVCKLILSAGLEFYTTNGMILTSLKTHVFDRPLDALKITVPALLYLLQNTLLYVALGNLSAPLFQVTYQCKLVTTAVVSTILLKRVYKFQQWICLFILSIGVAIVVLGEAAGKKNNDEESEKAQNLILGLTSVSISCICSAFAGVYFELVVKKQSPALDPMTGKEIAQPSLWMRNMQLAFYSLSIAYLQGMYETSKAAKDDNATMDELKSKSYLHGFTFWVWVLVIIQACGGLLVAAVIKYADNVLKGLATGVSVVFATTISILFLGTQLSIQFAFGATMILGSVYVFSNPVDVNKIKIMLGFSGTNGTVNPIKGSDNKLPF